MRTVPLPRSQLSKEVADIFAFLLEVNEKENVGAILRVAGGWVRDTLLHVPSHDIDIAIETIATDPPRPLITGEVFTSSIASYQASHALPTNTISVIKTNPEKSKHIETAQMTVMGVPLEFCHLRHDDYTTTSRVPTTRPGTPLEDALRRDYTVNALFYNLHTEMVEDYTTGLEDMEACILRTPLAPRETFLDDPLRLLRGIRFSGQLGYGLANEVIECAHDDTLVTMMRDKVSRERIGIEFGKMMGGNKPPYCSKLLLGTELIYNTVLQEVYYKKGKGKVTTNEIDFIRPIVTASILADGAQKSALTTFLEQWTVEHLEFLLSTLSIPKGLDRVTVSCVAMTVPLVAQSLLADVDASTYGPASTVDDRINAFIMMGLKQPGAVSDNVTRIIKGVRMLMAKGDGLLASLRESYDASKSASCPSSVRFAVGEAREALFEVLCTIATKTMIEQGAAVTIASYLLVCGATYAEVSAMVALLEADVNLVGSPSGAIPLRGDDVSASLGVEKKKTAQYIMAQRRFLLHEPTATREEVIAYLKTLTL